MKLVTQLQIILALVGIHTFWKYWSLLSVIIFPLHYYISPFQQAQQYHEHPILISDKIQHLYNKRYCRLPMFGVIMECFNVPFVCEVSCNNLIKQYKNEQPDHHGVPEGEDNVHGQIDENLCEVMRAWHILKQSTVWNVMFRALHFPCNTEYML